MSADRIAAIAAAEDALRENEKKNKNKIIDRHSNSTDNNVPVQSAIDNEIVTIQSSQNIKQKQPEDADANSQLHRGPLSSDSLQTQVNPIKSEQSQPRENLNDNQLGVKKEVSDTQQIVSDTQQVVSNKQQEEEEAVKKRPRLHENVMAAKDKMVENSNILDSDVRTNELTSRSPDRTHVEYVEQKSIANLEAHKIQDKQKIMDKNRFIKSENAKKQSPEIEARHKVQDLVKKANSAQDNAQELIKQAKLANQKAQTALEDAKSNQQEIQKDQEEKNNNLSANLAQLIDQAKISNKMAEKAQEKYDKLRRAADTAIEDFNTRFK